MIENADIIRVELFEKKSIVFLKNGSRLEAFEDFSYLEEDTANGIFIRIHPRHLINLNFITKVNLGSNPTVEMSNGNIIPLQKEKQSVVVSLFKKYCY